MLIILSPTGYRAGKAGAVPARARSLGERRTPTQKPTDGRSASPTRTTERPMFSSLKKGLDVLSSAASSVKNVATSSGTVLQFGDMQVVTTALLAEGGYSYVYSAREVSSNARSFAAKKVLAQDPETRDVAEVETKCLQQFDGHPGFVRCFGATSKPLPNRAVEYWMLLEFCTNGSLIDVIYKKSKGGNYEKRPALSAARILEIFEQVVASVAHMHAQSPPVRAAALSLSSASALPTPHFSLTSLLSRR